MMEKLSYRIEKQVHLIAIGKDQRIRWRWRAQKPLHIAGLARQTSPEILVVRERLARHEPFDVGVTDRFIGFRAQTGHRAWQAVHENISGEKPEIYGRLLSLYRPNGVYATGVNILIDVQTGKIITEVTADLARKAPRELLWIDTPGLPPHHGSGLYLLRLDPQTLKKQELHLPMPRLPGIQFDEYPAKKIRVIGDRIEVIYTGYRDKPPRESMQFIVRYRWSAGNNQKPEIQSLERPEWPK